MKITKTHLKKIIKEEFGSDEALLKAIENLTDKIEDLDVSIDFLGAAFSGGDPISVGIGQKTSGRAYRPYMAPNRKQDFQHEQKKLTKSQLKQIIKEELSGVLKELSQGEATLGSAGSKTHLQLAMYKRLRDGGHTREENPLSLRALYDGVDKYLEEFGLDARAIKDAKSYFQSIMRGDEFFSPDGDRMEFKPKPVKVGGSAGEQGLYLKEEKDNGWPKKVKKGRFTSWCKRNGFEDGASISCAKKAMDSGDASVRGMASFYMNTVKPKGKDAGDV